MLSILHSGCDDQIKYFITEQVNIEVQTFNKIIKQKIIDEIDSQLFQKGHVLNIHHNVISHF